MILKKRGANSKWKPKKEKNYRSRYYTHHKSLIKQEMTNHFNQANEYKSHCKKNVPFKI